MDTDLLWLGVIVVAVVLLVVRHGRGAGVKRGGMPSRRGADWGHMDRGGGDDGGDGGDGGGDGGC